MHLVPDSLHEGKRIVDRSKEDCRAKGAYPAALADYHMKLIADPMIPLGALKVAIAIGDHFNTKLFVAGMGLVAFPGIALLAEKTGLHRTTVMSAIRWLEARGHHKVKRQRSGKKNLVNNYIALRKTVAQLNGVVSRRRALPPSSVAALLPSSVAALPPSSAAARPELTNELSNELTNELPILYKSIASADADDGLGDSTTKKDEVELPGEEWIFLYLDFPFKH